MVLLLTSPFSPTLCYGWAAGMATASHVALAWRNMRRTQRNKVNRWALWIRAIVTDTQSRSLVSIWAITLYQYPINASIQPIGTCAFWNDLWLAVKWTSNLHFVKPEYRAKERCRCLVFLQTTWIKICWKVILEYLPNGTKKLTGFPRFKIRAKQYGLIKISQHFWPSTLILKLRQ